MKYTVLMAPPAAPLPTSNEAAVQAGRVVVLEGVLLGVGDGELPVQNLDVNGA